MNARQSLRGGRFAVIIKTALAAVAGEVVGLGIKNAGRLYNTLPTGYTTLTTLTLGKHKIACDMSESE